MNWVSTVFEFLTEHRWLFQGIGGLLVIGVLGFLFRRILFSNSEGSGPKQSVEQTVNLNLPETVSVREDDLPEGEQEEDFSTRTQAILSKLHTREEPVSACLAETLSLAQNFGLPELETLCERELTGWSFDSYEEHPPEWATYREVDVFISLVGKINTSHAAWMGSEERLVNYMESNPDDFLSTKLFVTQPISKLESQIRSEETGQSDRIVVMWFTRKQLMQDPENPDAPLYCYTKTSNITELIENLRSHLSERLINI